MTFEVGKTYRMRGGGVAGPLRENNIHESPYFLMGEVSGTKIANGIQTWTAFGVYDVLASRRGPCDLLPGAIEDEAKPDELAVLREEVAALQKRLDAIENAPPKMEERWINIYEDDLPKFTLHKTATVADNFASRAKVKRVACVSVMVPVKGSK